MNTTDKRANFLKTVPASARGIIERAFAGTPSKTNAIRAKCLDCAHFVRAEIESCRVVICPLHNYRPYRPSNHAAPPLLGS